MKALPGVVTAALLAAWLLAWSLGEPVPAPLGPGGGEPGMTGPGLPPLDIPCAGHVLEADAALRDPSFAGARVLLCVMDQDGALGVVLGRRGRVHAREVWPDAPVAMGRASWGGPVAPGQGVALYRAENGSLRMTTLGFRAEFPATGWMRPARVADGDVLWVGTGYSGWVAGQLEQEVEAGAWVLTDLDGMGLLGGGGAP